MTAEPMERAQANAMTADIGNSEFHLADDTVGCLISNCIINLTPDRLAVFREMHRVLEPSGSWRNRHTI